jgi:hypothetical protein
MALHQAIGVGAQWSSKCHLRDSLRLMASGALPRLQIDDAMVRADG